MLKFNISDSVIMQIQGGPTRYAATLKVTNFN